jgi:holo-[acyl-carrier protein] synthase
MILSVGLDLLSIPRLKAALKRHPRLKERVFTEAERRACDRKSAPLGSYAARFAAKEAAMKALGTGWGQGVGWKDIEVVGGMGRPPSLAFYGAAATRFEAMGGAKTHLSLTHEKEMAAAVVVIEGQ